MTSTGRGVPDRAMTVAATLVIGFALVACGTETAPEAEATAIPTSEPAPTATPLPSPDPTPTATPAHAHGCRPDPATSASSGWREFVSPESSFALRHPDDWEDYTGTITFQPAELFDPLTIAELDAEPERDRDMAVVLADPELGAGFAVMTLEGVRSSTAEVYPRMVDWVSSGELISEVLDTEMPGCVDGEPALGFQLIGANAELDLDTGELVETGDDVHVQGWFLVRDGVLYYVQWVAPDLGDMAVVDEILRTWEWSDAPADVASDVILSAGMVLERPPSGGSVDRSAYRSSFRTDAPRLSLVYELAPGTETRVTFTWRQDGMILFTDTFDWTAGNEWGWAGIVPPPDGLGFEPGNYEVEIRLDSGERHSVPFTIVDG